MAPDVVVHRQQLLHSCMQDLMAANPNAPSLTPLLAFLNPQHITCPMEQNNVTSSATHEVSPISSPSVGPSSARGVPQGVLQGSCGSRVRLLTELPVRLTARELMQRQQGCCAGCTGRLTLPYLASGWLGHLHSKVSYLFCAQMTTVAATIEQLPHELG